MSVYQVGTKRKNLVVPLHASRSGHLQEYETGKLQGCY